MSQIIIITEGVFPFYLSTSELGGTGRHGFFRLALSTDTFHLFFKTHCSLSHSKCSMTSTSRIKASIYL